MVSRSEDITPSKANKASACTVICLEEYDSTRFAYKLKAPTTLLYELRENRISTPATLFEE
jgi:hypothetical protein